MILTQENANELDGKKISATHGLFHYYPLSVVKQPSGYHVIDRFGTMFRIPDEGLYYEYVL